MAKFMVLYSSKVSAKELMTGTTPEQVEAGMREWFVWREKASVDFNVEFGLPLEALDHITADGVTDSKSQAFGYTIVEGESKDELIKLLKVHPHLNRPNTSIDVFEMLPIVAM